MRPSNRRASVVLPLPLSPTKAVMDGGSSAMASEKSSTAVIRGPRSPRPKTLVTARASSKADISFPGGGLQRALRRARFIKMACDEVVWANFAQNRRVDFATSHRMRAARAERATTRTIEQRRGQPGYAQEGAFAFQGRQARDEELA